MKFDLIGFKSIYSPIDGISSNYLINENGDIYSTITGQFLKQITTEKGYKVISLNTIYGTRIQRRVHRLVMETFGYQENCELLEVDHIDGNKANNNISNLEFVTGKENVRRAIDNNLREEWKGNKNPKAKITEEDAKEIVNLALRGFSDEIINEKFPNISLQEIRLILNGKEWKYLFSDNTINTIREMRNPTILSDKNKHSICKYYQDNISNFSQGYGAVKAFVLDALNFNNIEINESTYRMAKRLFYKYQDPEITSIYNY